MAADAITRSPDETEPGGQRSEVTTEALEVTLMELKVLNDARVQTSDCWTLMLAGTSNTSTAHSRTLLVLISLIGSFKAHLCSTSDTWTEEEEVT